MTELLVIQPHGDDGALGAGQAIIAHPGTVVVGVFLGVPDGDLPLTHFDAKSGATGARQAVEIRRAEDRRACAVMDATHIHLDHADRQYGMPQDETAITLDLAEVINQHPDRLVLGPLGLVHEDHVLVASCVRRACAELGRPLVFYEELPSRVLWPESVNTEGMIPYALPAGSLAVKEAAIACYESQSWALDRHACLVPERFWTLAPTEPETVEE